MMLSDADHEEVFAGSTFVSSIVGIPVGIPLALMVSSWFWFMLLPLALCFVTLIVYGARGIDTGYYGNAVLKQAQRLYYKTADNEFLSGYAKPLANNVYLHAKEGHEVDCVLCAPRLKALKSLVPSNHIGDDDIKAVEQYVSAKKELGM
jgi:hypothetical protein